MEEKSQNCLEEIVPLMNDVQDKISIMNSNDKKTLTERLAFSYPKDKATNESHQRYKQLLNSFWIAEEIDYSKDKEDFQILNENEQDLLVKVMAIFASGDGAINESIVNRFLMLSRNEFDARFYCAQMLNENVHAETYRLMLEATLDNPEEAVKLPEQIKSLQKVLEYLDILKYSKTYKEMYVFNAIGEYLIFSSLFAVIFWFRAYRPGKMRGVVQANELIARDEGVHAKQSCCKYLELTEDQKMTDEEIHEIFKKVVVMLEAFIEELVGKVVLEDLTPEQFKTYIKFIADDLLVELGHPKIYEIEACPLNFMTLQDLGIKANFYEAEVGQYSRGSINNNVVKMNFNKLLSQEKFLK